MSAGKAVDIYYVLTGNDLWGVMRARYLPELLPDYLIYDAGIEVRTGGKVLGTRTVRAGGFFGPDWDAPRGQLTAQVGPRRRQ